MTRNSLNPQLPSKAIVISLLGITLSFAMSAAEFNFKLQDRVPSETNPGEYELRHREQTWDPAKTAVIVCDMWDLHHCKNAVKRETELAPVMNRVLHEARDRGALIIHAPSSCMEPYENHPGRAMAKNAPKACNLPEKIHEWCNFIPEESAVKYPIDQSDGGEDDEKLEHEQWAKYLESIGRNPRAPWKSQIDVLDIEDNDAISDSGVEIWNLLESKGIENVILMGVHTNMCVLGRPFGLRQLAQNGKNVVLMRDMTDTMYNPAMWPYVDHYRGTALIIEYIEKTVCPTVTSDQLMGGEPFHFSKDPLYLQASR